MTNNQSFGKKESPTVLIWPVGDHEIAATQRVYDLISGMTGVPFRLVAFPAADWNNDLSPWKAPAVFKGEDFGGGADETLKTLLECCPDDGKKYIIGGYSLAGLFALWAAYKTDRFRGVAAASPSVWFPGFTGFMRSGECGAGCVYLSLGDRESKTRNPVMATVGDKINEARDILTASGVKCALEWNEGNHFKDPDVRTAKAFAYVLKDIVGS